MKKPHLFIGSSSENVLYAYALQNQLQHSADVQLWNQGFFELNTGYLDSLTNGLKDSDFGVFIFAPDDILKFRYTTLVSVRDNVLFEFGLFMGKLGKERVFFVLPKEQGNLRLPSDLLGISTVTFDAGRSSVEAALGPACFKILEAINKFGVRQERLGPPISGVVEDWKAGCMVDSIGTDWHTTGRFDVKPAPLSQDSFRSGLLAGLQRSSAYGQCVLGGFQKLISHINPLSDTILPLLHRKDKMLAREVFENVFHKYKDYHSTSFSPLMDILPRLKAQADESIQIFSSYDLMESSNRLEYALDPFQGAEKRIRERREVAIIKNSGLNDDENRKLCGAILNLNAVCGSVVLSANDYLNQLMTVFFSAAKEDGRE